MANGNGGVLITSAFASILVLGGISYGSLSADVENKADKAEFAALKANVEHIKESVDENKTALEKNKEAINENGRKLDRLLQAAGS